MSFPPEAASSSPRARAPEADVRRRSRASPRRQPPSPAPRRHRRRRLRQGRHADRLPRDVGRLGAPLGGRLEAATRRPVSGDVFAAIGFDPTSGRVAPRRAARHRHDGRDRRSGGGGHAPLVPERRGRPAGGRCRLVRARPVALAVPLADLAGAVRGAADAQAARLAVATTDDREPTDATLRHLGLRGDVSAHGLRRRRLRRRSRSRRCPRRSARGLAHPAGADGGDRRLAGRPRDGPLGRGGPGRSACCSGLGGDGDLADAEPVIDSVGDLLRT